MILFIILYIIWYLTGLIGFMIFFLREYGKVNLTDLLMSVFLFAHVGILIWIGMGIGLIHIRTGEIIIFRRGMRLRKK